MFSAYLVCILYLSHLCFVVLYAVLCFILNAILIVDMVSEVFRIIVAHYGQTLRGMSSPSSSSANGSGQLVTVQVPQFAPPPPLDPETDSAGWQRWKTISTAFSTTTKLATRPEEERTAMVISIIGLGVVDLYNSLPFANDGERADFTKTLEYLDEHFVGRQNVIYERYVFFSRQQGEHESIQDYVAALRKQASACDFNGITPEQIIRERIGCGLHDDRQRQALLSRAKLTLKQCLLECRGNEQSKKQPADMRIHN